jgi:hypothetical protein
MLATWKIGPALAAGDTVVLKPAEWTPLTASYFADLTRQAGIPDGVFNVVFGFGTEAGAALTAHPDLSRISFTGSVPTAKIIARAAADNLTPVSFELGGKSPCIVMADADLDLAAEIAVEQYANAARFMLTCNYVHKIIPALKSRCETFTISKPERTEFTARAATVLVTEGIDFDLDTLDDYVAGTYPDLRKCLNQLQSNSTTGKLLPVQGGVSEQDSTLVEATTLFKAGKVLDGRKLLLQYLSSNPGQIEEIYRWTYNNLDLWGKTQEQKDAAIIIIRNGLANLPLVGIPEISLAATLCELNQ